MVLGRDINKTFLGSPLKPPLQGIVIDPENI